MYCENNIYKRIDFFKSSLKNNNWVGVFINLVGVIITTI